MNKIRQLFCVLILYASNAQAQLYTDSLQIATKRAINYLHSLSESEFPSYNQRLLMVYLHNKYKLAQTPRKNVLSISNLLPEDSVVYCCYTPLIGKKVKVDEEELFRIFTKSNGIGKLMLWGIHSEKLPIDSCLADFESIEGARDMMHAALSLYWAGSNASLSQQQLVQKLRIKYKAEFIATMNLERPITDTGMEAILGLLFLKERESVSYNWIKEILAAQQANGGWSWTGEQDAKPHPHTTLLAVWILQLILHQE